MCADDASAQILLHLAPARLLTCSRGREGSHDICGTVAQAVEGYRRFSLPWEGLRRWSAYRPTMRTFTTTTTRIPPTTQPARRELARRASPSRRWTAMTSAAMATKAAVLRCRRRAAVARTGGGGGSRVWPGGGVIGWVCRVSLCDFPSRPGCRSLKYSTNRRPRGRRTVRSHVEVGGAVGIAEGVEDQGVQHRVEHLSQLSQPPHVMAQEARCQSPLMRLLPSGAQCVGGQVDSGGVQAETGCVQAETGGEQCVLPGTPR